MSERVSRRRLIKGAAAAATTAAAAAVVVAFDPISRSWATAAGSATVSVPALDGTLTTDPAAMQEAADDYGHIVHRLPVAVLRPGSVNDIVVMVRYAREQRLKIAMRGQGHVCYGQAQVDAGIVIDSRTLNAVHLILPDRAVVGPGLTWGELLRATVLQGLTPPVLTDYMGLSIGGTLSTGGIGGATQHYGVQVDTVLELQVVTGRGDLVTCSPLLNRDLFDAVLAGLGQYGIIVRATVALVPAPVLTLVFNLYYNDLESYLADQLMLLRDARFSYLEGQVNPPQVGPGWRYMIEAVSYYTLPNLPNQVALLDGLHDDRLSAVIKTGTYLDWAFRLEPFIAAFKVNGDWTRPHPLLDLFVPASQAATVVGNALATLTPTDIGVGPILLYPANTARFTRPLFRVPDEPEIFLFSLLRTTANSDPALLSSQLASNRALYNANVAAGGTWYPIGAISDYSQSDWRQHYGRMWNRVVSGKRSYDPDTVLTPGQRMF